MATDGRCKAFDAAADGFVRGEGAGSSRSSAWPTRSPTAIASWRYCRARPSIRTDAAAASPRRTDQRKKSVIREALSGAGVSALDVGYVETHGTGTALGDPIEVNALGAVYGAGRRS